MTAAAAPPPASFFPAFRVTDPGRNGPEFGIVTHPEAIRWPG